ncbi:Hsp20/alpha crystallin family protein [Streptomyces ficellus]|uniref:Hsp20/alpha crystallin family protein n=1 Tax=Streptomyces ficellus TaxID=1977088 RepID=A0ABT7Z4D6_9ACTN|nr:Hsp20/alpha crystallin family protein [Streptomyces ficellus]MDN3294332.1 Hsp20/alpha crystallin family protein [Streptomyces ficellus]
MLMRTDPFRELDRVTQELFSGVRRPSAFPMDAWRKDNTVWVAFDLPGVDPDSVDLKVERDVLTVQAERKPLTKEGADVLISERPSGTFTRQLFLGESLDTDNIEATYDAGVLSLRIPVAEQAKPRKIEISGGGHKELRA